MTAADAIATKLRQDWTTAVTGRTTPVPDVVRDSNGDPSTDAALGTGVLIFKNDDTVRAKTNTHDLIEVQHVDRLIQDKGSNSERVVDEVQIDIRISNRDIDDDEIREGVEVRMLGERDANNETDTLGGLAGEVKRQLNTIRKGFKEWDKSSHDQTIQYLRNTDARVTFALELEIIERNVQTPTT